GAVPVWVSEPARWIYGFKPGDWINLPVPGHKGAAARPFFVAGEWRDYGRQQGSIAMDLADYTALTGDELRTDAAIALALGAVPVWVSEPARWIYGFKPGDWINLPVPGHKGAAARPFFVAGEWRDYGRQQGSIAMDLADYTALTGDELRTDAAIDLARGAD